MMMELNKVLSINPDFSVEETMWRKWDWAHIAVNWPVWYITQIKGSMKCSRYRRTWQGAYNSMIHKNWQKVFRKFFRIIWSLYRISQKPAHQLNLNGSIIIKLLSENALKSLVGKTPESMYRSEVKNAFTHVCMHMHIRGYYVFTIKDFTSFTEV